MTVTRVFDVSVVLSADERRNPEQIGSLPLRSPEGNYVPLRQLADIYESSGRYIVLHRGAPRVQTITCNVAGRDVTSFVGEAKQRIGRLSFPAGAYVEFAGAAAAQAQSRRDLLVHSLLAGLGIVLLLSVVMGTRGTSYSFLPICLSPWLEACSRHFSLAVCFQLDRL